VQMSHAETNPSTAPHHVQHASRCYCDDTVTIAYCVGAVAPAHVAAGPPKMTQRALQLQPGAEQGSPLLTPCISPLRQKQRLAVRLTGVMGMCSWPACSLQQGVSRAQSAPSGQHSLSLRFLIIHPLTQCAGCQVVLYACLQSGTCLSHAVAHGHAADGLRARVSSLMDKISNVK